MVSREEARKIVEKEVGESLHGFQPSSIGRAHDSFFLDTDSGRYVLKIGKGEDRFQVEGPALELLNSETDVSVPNIAGFDNSKSDFDFMYLIIEFVEGENLDAWENENGAKFPYLSKNRKRSLLQSAGRQLGLLHSQTSFDSFGHFKYEHGGLEFRQEGSWPETFRKIILEEQASNFPDRFSHLKTLVENFVEESVHKLNAGNSALVHQDVRWPNIIAGRSEINSVIDWERAIAGDPYYDLAKTEQSLLQFKRPETRESYRKHFLKGYRDFKDLPDNWEEIRAFYRALRPVEAVWTFDGWTRGMSSDKKEKMALDKEKELKEKVEAFRKDYL
jgi:aminoglycoside phosphotransferase (APT) family kinase protein